MSTISDVKMTKIQEFPSVINLSAYFRKNISISVCSNVHVFD